MGRLAVVSATARRDVSFFGAGAAFFAAFSVFSFFAPPSQHQHYRRRRRRYRLRSKTRANMSLPASLVTFFSRLFFSTLSTRFAWSLSSCPRC